MKFKADEIASVIQKEIEDFQGQMQTSEVGRVVEVGDGIARVVGLSSAMAGEMVQFSGGAMGMCFNLEENSVGIIILGDYLQIQEGDEVKTTGELLSVPVGDAMVGRVVDPLGNPLDGKGPIVTNERRPLETAAPGVAGRQPVKQPLQTGIKAVDSMTPIGRGQRELIIGDRKTGKTAIALDTIINQKGGDVICVYVGCGQRASTIASVVDALEANGAMDYTIVVSASASDPAPLQYIAPYAGAAMAEYFMAQGQAHALCVYDDLTKQAQAYRQLVTADATSAGTRSLSRRRVLLPLAAAGTFGQAQRRTWAAAVDDGVADHRNTRRRGLGVHSHQRDFDHRRPDLPGAGPVLCRRPSRHQRRHLGLPRGWQRPDEGDEKGSRLVATRPGCVSRAGGVRPTRHGTRQGDASSSSTADTAWWNCSSSRSTSQCTSADQVISIYAGTNGYLDAVPVNRRRGPRRTGDAAIRPGRAQRSPQCHSSKPANSPN